MSERDLEVAWALYDQVCDSEQHERIQLIVREYREECVKAERERIYRLLEATVRPYPAKDCGYAVRELMVTLRKQND